MSRITVCAIIAMSFGSPAGAAESKKVSVACFVRNYLCIPDNPRGCQWATDPGYESDIILVKDPLYPNPSYPNEIWTGYKSDTLHYPGDETFYRFKTTVQIAPDGTQSYGSSLSYEWKNIVSVGEGSKSVGASIIDNSIPSSELYRGRGYFCMITKPAN